MDKAIKVLCKELKSVYDENLSLRIRHESTFKASDHALEIKALNDKHDLEIKALNDKHVVEMEELDKSLRLQHETVMTQTFEKNINVLALPLSMSAGPYPFPVKHSHSP